MNTQTLSEAPPSPALGKIRRIAALALFCALFLPLSRCAKGSAPQPPSPAAAALGLRLFPRSDNQTTYRYAIPNLSFRGSAAIGSVLTVLAFVWPVLVFLAFKRFTAARVAWWRYLLELVLSAGSIWLVYMITSGDDQRLYGSYVVFGSAGVYGASALVYLVLAIRVAANRRRELKHAGAEAGSR